MLGSRERPGFTESPSAVIPEAHFERLKRVRVSQQMACDEREFLGDMMKAEDEADENIAWKMNYFNGYGHNSWSMLGHQI